MNTSDRVRRRPVGRSAAAAVVRRTRPTPRRRGLRIGVLVFVSLLAGVAWTLLSLLESNVPPSASVRELALGVPATWSVELTTLGDVDPQTFDQLRSELENRGVDIQPSRSGGTGRRRVLRLVASSALVTSASLVPTAGVVSQVSPLSAAQESRLVALQGEALRLARSSPDLGSDSRSADVAGILEWSTGEIPPELSVPVFPATEFARLNRRVGESGQCRCALVEFPESWGRDIDPRTVMDAAAPPDAPAVSTPVAISMLIDESASALDGPDPTSWSDDLGDWLATTRTVSHPDVHIPLYRRAGNNIEFVGDALAVAPGWAEKGPIWWAPSHERIASTDVLLFTAQHVDGSRCIGAALRRETEERFEPTADPVICGDLHDPAVISWDGSEWLLFASPEPDGWELVSVQLDPISLTADPASRVLLLKAESEWQTDLQGNKRVENPDLVTLPGSERAMLIFSGGDWTTDDYATGVAWCWSPRTACEVDPDGSPLLRDGSTERGSVTGFGGASVDAVRDGSVDLVAHAYLHGRGSRQQADRVPLHVTLLWNDAVD